MADADADSEPRTEEPSPRRRAQARREGQVGRSVGLTAAGGLLALALSLPWLGGDIAVGFRALLLESLRSASGGPGPGATWTALASSYRALLLPVAAALLLIGLGAALSGVAQVGALFSLHAVSPARARPDFAARLRDRFSAERASFGVLALVQWLLLAAVVGWALGPSFAGVRAASLGTVGGALAGLAALLPQLLLALAIAGVFVGIVDLLLRRLQVAARLRVGRRQRERERRAEEGDPALRAERQRRHAELATLADLPRARLLVCDRAGWAVALAHDPSSPAAPRVLARARGRFADQLRARCHGLGVQVAEAPELARALFRHGPGEHIGRDFYEPVARLMRGAAA